MSEQKTVPVWKKMIPGFIRKDFVRKIIALFLELGRQGNVVKNKRT